MSSSNIKPQKFSQSYNLLPSEPWEYVGAPSMPFITPDIPPGNTFKLVEKLTHSSISTTHTNQGSRISYMKVQNQLEMDAQII